MEGESLRGDDLEVVTHIVRHEVAVEASMSRVVGTAMQPGGHPFVGLDLLVVGLGNA